MPEADDHTAIINQSIDLNALVKAVGHPSAGAIATFLGVTRDNFQDKEVIQLEYEAYVPMAEKVMKNICKQIHERWDVVTIAMEHRLGICPVGEASVGIAISSAHRKESLEATHYAIDAIKANAPIWKKEYYADGSMTNEANGAAAKWKSNSEWQGGDASISQAISAAEKDQDSNL